MTTMDLHVRCKAKALNYKSALVTAEAWPGFLKFAESITPIFSGVEIKVQANQSKHTSRVC